MVDLIVFRPWPDGGAGREGVAALGEPVLAPFTLAEVGTPKCPWPAEDQEFLLDWLAAPSAQAWLQASFNDLHAIQARVRETQPESLEGLLD